MNVILIIGILSLLIKIAIILLIVLSIGMAFFYIFIFGIVPGKIYNRFRINSIMKKVKKMGPIKPEKENKIFITGHISEDKIIKVIREIKFLESDNRFPEIFILLKSRGGKIFATHALCQVMKKCKKPIVITSSKAHSAAALILCCGTKGKRLIYQGSKVFIHEVKIHIDKSDNLITKIFWLIERKRLNKIDSKLLAKKTGQSFKKVVNDRKNKTYFTAQEALEYGFVDTII